MIASLSKVECHDSKKSILLKKKYLVKLVAEALVDKGCIKVLDVHSKTETILELVSFSEFQVKLVTKALINTYGCLSVRMLKNGLTR